MVLQWYCNNLCYMSKTALRAYLKQSAKVHLGKCGGYKAFVTRQGPRVVFKGLTKRLEERVFSKASLPRAALNNSSRRGWKGPNAGRRRGAAVDKQLTAIANGTFKQTTHTHELTKVALAVLDKHKLVPVCGQRGVCKQQIATAVDFVCTCSDELWLVELKCGFEDVRSIPGKYRGREACFAGRFAACKDSAEHRHMAQLAATVAMFEQETEMIETLRQQHGVTQIRACVLYVCESGADLVPLPHWWRTRGARLLAMLR